MRFIFAGTAPFAATQLTALLSAGHEVVLVLTQPDRPSGRGLKKTYSAVKRVANDSNVPFVQPVTLKAAALQEELASIAVDAWVVAAYGLILPALILHAPRFGCLNVHASLLPRWRGAAPIQRAIMAGDAETGISIMRMDEGLDTGPLFLQRATAILPQDTAGSLHDRLASLGAQVLVEVLDRLAVGTIAAFPQRSTGVCYAAKLTRSDACIDWSLPSQSVARMIRALDPAPGAHTLIKDQMIKIWRSKAHDMKTDRAPGTVLDITSDAIHVACGCGVLLISELQRAGARRLSAGEFVRGFALRAGERFGG